MVLVLFMFRLTLTRISLSLAGRLIGELRSGGVNASTDPKQLSSQQVVRLHQLLHEVRARCIAIAHHHASI